MMQLPHIALAGCILTLTLGMIGAVALEWRYRKSQRNDAQRWPWIEIGFAFLMLATTARGEWFEYTPRGAVDGKGILKDVTSRTHDPQLNKFKNDKATWAHEGTHCVNGDITNRVGGGRHGFYIGDGRAMVLSEPHVSFAAIDRHVTKYRNDTYRMYFKQAKNNNDRLDFLDEWTAYTNDLQCAVELNLRDDGNTDRATWFCHYAAAVLATVEETDPQYADLADLREFVSWQTDRVQKLREERGQGHERPSESEAFANYCELHKQYADDHRLYEVEKAYKGRQVSWHGVVSDFSHTGTSIYVKPSNGVDVEAHVSMNDRPIPRSFHIGDPVLLQGRISAVSLFGPIFLDGHLTHESAE